VTRGLLNSAEGNGQNVENNRQRQCPEAEVDFQGGASRTARHEPGDAGESQCVHSLALWRVRPCLPGYKRVSQGRTSMEIFR